MTNHLINEIVSLYLKHGWKIHQILLKPEHKAVANEPLLTNVPVKETAFDAVWFSRPSHSNREAWELRLIAESPYALFETIRMDATEQAKQELLLEMESRMKEKLTTDH